MLWGVPKGSYASNANGPCRVFEFRKMVQVDLLFSFGDTDRTRDGSDSGVTHLLNM